jgi:hypothetical protein
MLYDRTFLETEADRVLGSRTSEQFLKAATGTLVPLLGRSPNWWKCFGPYYPVIQKMLREYQPDFELPNSWGEPPDYLTLYDAGDNLLNWVAAMSYVNREGDYMSHPDQPHTIQLADGSNALYMPGVGILEVV